MYTKTAFVVLLLAFVVSAVAGEESDLKIGPPARFAVKVDEHGVVELSWHSPLDDDDNTVDGYKLQRSTNRHFSGMIHVLAESNTKLYRDHDVEMGTLYFYRVAAHNGAGYGQWATLDVTPMGKSATKVRTDGGTPGSDGGSTLVRGFRTPCPLDCSGNGLCQRSTQECRCVQGFIGAACNVAAPVVQPRPQTAPVQTTSNSESSSSDSGDEDSGSSSSDRSGDGSHVRAKEPGYCSKMCDAGCTFTCRRYCAVTCPRTNTAPPVLCTSKCGEGKCSAPCSKMCAEQCPEVGQISLTDSSNLPGGKRHAQEEQLMKDKMKWAATKEQLEKTEAEAKVTVQRLGATPKKVVSCAKRGVDGQCLEFAWSLPGS